MSAVRADRLWLIASAADHDPVESLGRAAGPGYSPVMRLLIALAVSSALLAGCGDSDEPKSETTGTPETSAAAELGLDDLCPRLQSVATVDDFAETSAWQAAVSELDALEEEGDSSVDVAVAKVRPGIKANLDYALAGKPAGEGLDAFSGLTDARKSVAAACP